MIAAPRSHQRRDGLPPKQDLPQPTDYHLTLCCCRNFVISPWMYSFFSRSSPSMSRFCATQFAICTFSTHPALPVQRGRLAARVAVVRQQCGRIPSYDLLHGRRINVIGDDRLRLVELVGGEWHFGLQLPTFVDVVAQRVTRRFIHFQRQWPPTQSHAVEHAQCAQRALRLLILAVAVGEPVALVALNTLP